MKNPTVSIVGLGYVGLSTAVCMAHSGIPVVGIEVDRGKLRSILRGQTPFHEPGLGTMLRSSLKRRTLECTADYRKAIQGTSLTFLTVGTPSRPDGSIDLAYLRSAATDVGRELARKPGYHCVVVKSTAVPGTTEGPVRALLEEHSGKKCGKGFGLSANPEFLREGQSVQDTLHPDAIVIGSVDDRSKTALLSMYRKFYGTLPSVITTTPANAELIKYAVNTFRGTQLSFLNTLANLCQTVPGADIDEVAKGLNTITKVDPRYLKAGLGYGGSCIPKDLRALIAQSKQAGANPKLLEAALRVNDLQPSVVIAMVRGLLGKLVGRRIAVLGLAFKANTDDVRESAAIKLVNHLVLLRARVAVYDPAAMDNARKVLDRSVEYSGSVKGCLAGADCLVIATAWEEFGKIRPSDLKKLMRNAAVVDARRLFDPKRLEAAGVKWATVGTGPFLNPKSGRKSDLDL